MDREKYDKLVVIVAIVATIVSVALIWAMLSNLL